jgi:hypothetical protein
MSTDIRIQIQDHEPMLAAVKDEILLIVLRMLRDQAQHTLVAQ